MCLAVHQNRIIGPWTTTFEGMILPFHKNTFLFDISSSFPCTSCRTDRVFSSRSFANFERSSCLLRCELRADPGKPRAAHWTWIIYRSNLFYFVPPFSTRILIFCAIPFKYLKQMESSTIQWIGPSDYLVWNQWVAGKPTDFRCSCHALSTTYTSGISSPVASLFYSLNSYPFKTTSSYHYSHSKTIISNSPLEVEVFTEIAHHTFTRTKTRAWKAWPNWIICFWGFHIAGYARI